MSDIEHSILSLRNLFAFDALFTFGHANAEK